MHPCLAVQDIVELVVCFAEDAHDSAEDQPSPSLAVLQTCRTFYEPGCNARWRRITKLGPLLRLFPTNPAIMNGYPLFPEDLLQVNRLDSWTRFMHHAPRVRVFDCVWKWDTIAYLRILHAFRPNQDTPLLPGLRTLIHSTSDASLSIAEKLDPVKFLAHSGLRSLKMRYRRGSVDASSLAFLLQLAPGLHRLEITILLSTGRVNFPALSHLTAFHCQSALLSPSFMRHLAELPSLKILDARIDALSVSSLRNGIALFPALRGLLVTTAGPDADAERLLHLIASRQLTVFYLCLDSLPSSSTIRQYVSFLAQQPLLSRVELRVQRDSDNAGGQRQTPEWNVAGDDLRPLLALSRMTTFVLRGLPLSLMDGYLEEMATAWPLLRDLVLSPSSWHSQSGLTLDALKPLSLHCPELRCISVSIVVAEPPVSPPPRPKSLWRLNSFPSLRLPSPFTKFRSHSKAVVVSDDPVTDNGDSVCPHLKHIDFANSSIDDPHRVASFITRIFPNVITVTDVCHCMPNSTILEKINELLIEESAERWEAIDEMTLTTKDSRMPNPLLDILPGPGTELIVVD